MFGRALFACSVFTLLQFQNTHSCELGPVHVTVPKKLPPSFVISQVNLEGCVFRPVAFSSSDPDFDVTSDGSISTVRSLTITHRTFAVLLEDTSGLKQRVEIILSCKYEPSLKSGSGDHKRFKRRWRPLPFSIVENDPPKDLERISSDSSVNYTVRYSIDGPGVTTEPKGLFEVDELTGLLRVKRPVDREQYPVFTFKAYARDLSGRETDLFLPVVVNVEDVNDNAPVFTPNRFFTAQELCKPGTLIGVVNATDRDDPKTGLHTVIRYSLINATNMFAIDGFSGRLTAKTHTLDREAQDKVYVAVEARDMAGDPIGLATTGTYVVSLTDVNDNPPTFKEKLFKAKVKENQENVMVLRIPVEDKDMPNTPNWRAVFEVTKGNQSGNFRVETDPKTNEGLLYVIKSLDYEKAQKVDLEITARNEVPLVGTDAKWNSVPVELTVEDVDEGPEFSPPILRLKVKENIPNGTVIGVYKALDPETKTSNGIKYYKISDPGNWINVALNTGELSTANTIDRESPLVFNDTYNITIRAVDETKKTGNGMVIILIEDENDNMPVIPNTLNVCNKDDTLGSVLVEASDKDKPPYSTPFKFELGAEQDGKWKLKDQTESSVVLQQTVPMPNGLYSVPLVVKDLQGFGKEQTVNVRVCSCERETNGQAVCGARSASTSFGSWGILALVLSLLLLLVLCLLLVFFCSTKQEKLYLTDDTGTGGMLLKSNTEAPGEEVKDGNLMMIPGGDVVDGSIQGATMENQNVTSSGGHYGQSFYHGGGVYNTTTQEFGTERYFSSGMYGDRYDGNLHGNALFQKYSTTSALDTWRTNGRYLDNKLAYFGEEEEGRYADDVLKTYGHEGVGSPAGSVGCCSILGDQESMEFLNTLGPKFRPLADVLSRTNHTGH